MEDNILSKFETLNLGNGFYFYCNELYFFTPEELKINFEKALQKIKKLLNEN
jgi:hypothetical protein